MKSASLINAYASKERPAADEVNIQLAYYNTSNVGRYIKYLWL